MRRQAASFSAHFLITGDNKSLYPGALNAQEFFLPINRAAEWKAINVPAHVNVNVTNVSVLSSFLIDIRSKTNEHFLH